MKMYLQEEGCLCQSLMVQFDGSSSSQSQFEEKHGCLNCTQSCKCASECINKFWVPFSADKLDIKSCNSHGFVRVVSDDEKLKVKHNLIQMQNDMKLNINTEKLVSCPHILMDFNGFHIKQVLDNCNKLFTIDDIYKYIEIWRRQYAVGILHALDSVFHDVDTEELNVFITKGMNESIFSEWGHIRNDSELLDMVDSQDLEMGSSSDNIASMSIDL